MKNVPSMMRSWLPARVPEAHKYDFGHVLVLGGSRGLMGAPRLAALGALRGGAGLVTLGVPDFLEPIAAQGPWEAMSLALPAGPGGLSVEALATVRAYVDKKRVTAVALGPGMGQGKETGPFVRSYLAGLSIPTVIDADGLNALARLGPIDTECPLILTPHAGEMARLLGTTPDAVQKDRVAAVRTVARRYKAVVALKGHKTLVSDGDQIHVNKTGSPAMATAGMGDVLTGLVAALIAQVDADGLPERLWRAAVLGVFLHGRAGQSAARQNNSISVLATDLFISPRR
jgi:hydroxyethylthiazole kinase-like uncharacterized protein yjeF